MERTTTVRAATALVFATGLVACGAGSEATGGGWAGEMTDSAGVTVVSNPAQGVWEAGEAWTVTEELRIGGMEADERYQFGQIASIEVDAEGRIYAADQQAQMVRVYSPEGVWERDIGSPGAGPGEFGLGLTGVFTDGDRVHVADMGNIRLSTFDTEGEFLESSPLDLTRGIPIRWDQQPDGAVVVQLRSAGEGVGEDIADGDAIRVVGEEEAILRLPRGESFEMSSSGIPQFNLFEPEPAWDLGEDGRIATGVNDEYRIVLHDLDGNPTRIVSKPFEQRPVTESAQRTILDAFGDLLLDQGVPPAMLDQFLAGVSFADFYPQFAQIVLAADGGIWVQQLQTADDVGENEDFNPQDLGSNRWDVFDPEGRFLGEMEMPLRFQPILFTGDRIYGFQRDEFDVQSVVRYRVERG